MKIAMILTNGFDPDPRVYKEAKTLVGLGHTVDILCWDRSGAYLEKPEEIIDGIHIIRFFGNASYGSGYKQLGKFLDFKNNVLNYIKDKRFDAIHCHDFDGFFIGYAVNKKLKLKLVYDEHDLFYMYFADRKGMLNKLVYYFIMFAEKWMLKKVDTHIVVTEAMAKLYSNISKTVRVINNAPYNDLFTDIEKTASDKLRIGFIGSVRYYEEMKALIDASQKYKDKVEIIISGRGIFLDKLKEYTAALENVKITGGYSIDQIEGLYKNIDVTYAFYPESVATISMPNKFFESIITETPILANGQTEFGEEVEKNQLGYALSSTNLKEQLDEVLYKLVNNKDEKYGIIRNMKAIKNDYFWEANEEKLKEIYK